MLGAILIGICIAAGLVAAGILFVLYGPTVTLDIPDAKPPVQEPSVVPPRAGPERMSRGARSSELAELRQRLRELQAARVSVA